MERPENTFSDPVNRRAFLQRATFAGLGAALVLLQGDPLPVRADAPEGNIPDPSELPGIPGANKDQAVLNFALTLETLEAALYVIALNHASGRDLKAPLESDMGAYSLKVGTGKLDEAASRAGFRYLTQYAQVEAAHRDFLREAIKGQGGTPVPPNAGGYHFPSGPGDTLDEVLKNILTVEEVGVRAYLGASTLFSSPSSGLLTAAACIYSTECSHSSAIRMVLGITPGPVKMIGDKQAFPVQASEGQLEYFLDPRDVLAAVQPYMVK
jgi:hypothetical protein